MNSHSTGAFPDKVMARFWNYVDRRGPDDCWPWLGNRIKDGRGRFWAFGRDFTASRFALMVSTGEMVDNSSVFACHACDNPGCCNPEHLWWGDNKTNIRDASAKGRLAGQSKTHCVRGHLFDGGNTRYYPNGRRTCKTCQRLVHQKKHAANTEAMARKREGQRRRRALERAALAAPKRDGNASRKDPAS